MKAAVLEAMDSYWRSTYDFLRENFASDDALVVPDTWQSFWPNGAAPRQTGGRSPDEFRAVVIHKGDFEAFSPRFLRRAIQTLHPAFANEVFVVLSPTEPLTSAMVAPPMHVQSLRQMEQWARFQSGGAVAESAIGHPITRGELLDRMSRFIQRRLVKQVGGSDHIALSETEHSFNNTDWFWVDDSAKAAELLCVPRLRMQDPAMTDRLIDFIVDMSKGPFIHRRVGPPALTIEQDDPANFKLNNPFNILYGNLTTGKIFVAIRYNDGRTRPLTCLTSNVVSARWRGEVHSCIVERNIVSHDIALSQDKAVLSYTSRLTAGDGSATVLAMVTYSYTLHSDRTDIGVEVKFVPERNRLLSDVKLTTTFGELGHHGSIDRARILGVDGEQEILSPAPGHMKLTRKPFKYMNLDESRTMYGFATGVHAVLQNPERLIEVAANSNGNGHFGEISNLYRQKWATRWTPVRISEIRMVTGGGFYEYPEYYRHLMVDKPPIPGASIDPSMSYDLGAELNSVAAYLLFSRAGEYEVQPPSLERLAALKTWFDRHLDIYFAHVPLDDPTKYQTIFVRGLTFTVLALDTAHRAYSEEVYSERILKCAKALLAIQFQVSGAEDDAAVFNSDVHPELDCHTTAMLALVRALRHGADPAAVAIGIGRGLRAIRIATMPDGAPGQGKLLHPTLQMQQRADGPVDSGYWTFKLGVSLRAFHAIRAAVADGRLHLDEDTLAYLARLEHTARSAITHAMVVQHDEIEVLTSANSGETNSETQPWVALGLAPATEWGSDGAAFDYDADTGLRLYDDGTIAAAF
jgi:hypothetical protein